MYYRAEVVGYNTLFKALHEIVNLYTDDDGEAHPEFQGYGLEPFIYDLEGALKEIEDILPIPEVNFSIHNTQSLFTEYGYTYFEENLLDIQYALEPLGFQLDIFEADIDETQIIYEDIYQVVYKM